MVWDAVTDVGGDVADFAGDAVEESVSPAVDPEDNPVTEMIREETDLGEDELPTAEIVGLTDEDGNRAVVTDSGDLYDEVTSDEFSFNFGDVADQVGDDARERAGDIWEVVPTWAWLLGGFVTLGAAFVYLRPLISIAGGVIPA